MERDSNTFTIEVDLLNGGAKMTLLVIPSIDEENIKSDRNEFVTVLDGVTLAVIKYDLDEVWSLVEGALSQEAVDKIGKEIDNHYL